MAKFTLHGKTAEELERMELGEFIKIIASKERRALKRALKNGFPADQKKLLDSIKKEQKKFHRTKCREMVIIPQMLGCKIGVHNGKEYVTVEMTVDKLGHRLGEFALTRRQVKHSAPGFGATRSSKYIPLK
jgi:small subunit ribosomal protein S19